MRKTLALAVAVILIAGSAAAQKNTTKILDADKVGAVATVVQFVAGFNKGDVKTALATCASPSAVIDDFPPYAWSGANGCADWAAAYDSFTKQNGITNGHVTLGPKPLFVEVTGDRAYVIMSSGFSYKLKGKPVNEPGARFTVGLQKKGNDWKITAWTWSSH